ncbi:MAG TPA: hypothetical protein VHE33_13035, partial [Acidobacteriaceae bacterium]|nr:hypothetical protein [Acidobacteriaceae bacterium]
TPPSRWHFVAREEMPARFGTEARIIFGSLRTAEAVPFQTQPGMPSRRCTGALEDFVRIFDHGTVVP